jgi:hypothetical protein
MKQNKEEMIEDFAKMPVLDVIELLDLLKIREYSSVFPTKSFQDALKDLYPALGKRIEQNPKEYGFTRTEVKEMKQKAKEYHQKKP